MSPSEAKSRPTSTRRLFCPTPSWLIFGLLVVEGLLWLSERFGWSWFNEKKGWTVLIGVAVVGGAMILMLVWLAIAFLFRWRFQFSIRVLLLIVTATAVPFSWLAVEMKAAKEQKEAVEEFKRFGCVRYNWEFSADGHAALDNPPPPGPEWLRNLLGVDFFGSVTDVHLWCSGVTDANVKHLQALPHLQWLELSIHSGYAHGAEIY